MRRFVSLSLLPLTACTVAQSNATAQSAPPPPAACRNESLAQFTGQPASQEVGHQIMLASRARVVRWVPKGAAVTMDFREDRVTVYLDASNRVERASCG